jgi:hypothetical protein
MARFFGAAIAGAILNLVTGQFDVAAARTADDQRLHLLDTKVTDVPRSLPREGSMAVRGGLDPDASRKVRATSGGYNGADIGLAVELGLETARWRPGPGSARDKYALRQIEFAGRLPLAGTLDVLALGEALHMKRDVEAAPVTPSPGRVLGGWLGGGLAGRAWSASAQYETVGTKDRSRPLHRMAELLGGAPRNLEGLVLRYTQRRAVSGRRAITWDARARFSRRNGEDCSILGADGPARDRSIEVTMRLDL